MEKALKKFVVVVLFLLPMIIFAQNEKGTLDSYRVAAKQGNPVAEFNVGLISYEGRGVPKDYEKALKWFRLASKKGHPAAQHYLGLFFDKGFGVKKDPKKAEYPSHLGRPACQMKSEVFLDPSHGFRTGQVKRGNGN